jgi:phospholipase C
MAQENHSFDNYFGALREYWAKNGYPDESFDGLPQFNPRSGEAPLFGPAPSNPSCSPDAPAPARCVYDTSNPAASFHYVTQCPETPFGAWSESHVDWDYFDATGLQPAKLNGFVWAAAIDARNSKFHDTNGIRAMGYFDGDDLNYYYFMASNFATSDRWFQPIMTRTHPNRESMVAGTSQGYIYQPGYDSGDKPLLTATTIFQELQDAGITWKIYVNPKGTNCSGPPYDPACLITYTYVRYFSWGLTIPSKYPQNIVPISEYFTDVENGTLPQVAEIEPATSAGLDEHPTINPRYPGYIQLGAKYVSTLINALMNSPSWKDSAFILTYDESGGYYDHVSPQKEPSPDGIKPLDLTPLDRCAKSTGPTCDFVYTGYRIPLLVVSPFTKKHYVSHTVADTTAILKLIETRFNLPSLTKRDAAQMDMTEFFNFTKPPWITPPIPPAQNTSAPCYINKLP